MAVTVRRDLAPRFRAAALLLGLALLPLRAAPVEAGAGETLQLSSDLRVAVRNGREVELEVLGGKGEDFVSIAERTTGSDTYARTIRALNDTRVVADRWIRVPLGLLTRELRSLVMRNLFPLDGRHNDEWIHVAHSGRLTIYDEGLWQVAVWFTGRGEDFSELMRINGLSSPELRDGQRVRIPAALIHPAFRARMRSTDGALEYDTDPDGPFAAYRLEPGEALYSAVVMRFTGRTGADDVREVALRLLERSHIRDARDIPVGYEVKIPLDLLEPDFLPRGHPRRREADERRAALERELQREPLRGTGGGLKGVLIVLDPGHGGRDLGTMNNGIWEHDYVYDVTCRLKKMLATETAARVVLTLEDRETGCVPSVGDKLVANHQGTVLTHPVFLAKEEGEAKIGVNLRWYLANSVYRKALKEGTKSDRVVFISLHADSRHPGVRAAMVYVPGEEYRTRTYGSTSATYRRYEEVREQPTVRFSKKERVRSEAVSHKSADAIVDSMRDTGLPIQPYQPVRNRIIRGKQRWVPAVLRGNEIPTKVLVEMLNLSNREDARLLGSAQLALFRHFGETPAPKATTTAAQ
jgi:N-acetylmuramoyl-L-alanine amidase